MQVRTVIIGLGNVGRRLLELVDKKRQPLRDRFDLEFVIAGAGDTTGGAEYFRGLDIGTILELKRSGKGITAYPSHGRGEMTPVDVVRSSEASLLVELSPTNLKSGEPGLSVIREALGRKWNVVTANKGPLVLAYADLTERAKSQGVKLLHSATVTGGLPTLNLGQRDLAPSDIWKFEGVVNGTTNYILTKMSEGESFAAALHHAQVAGHAEADPSLDVDGWDAANKLVIVANAALHRPTRLEDVQVEGIREVTGEQLRAARAEGKVIKLIACAEREGNDYRLTVRPTALPADHFLAQLSADMMGVIYHTDINGTIYARIEEADPYPTAAAVLRDMVAVYT